MGETKYLKYDWPDYQIYMEHPDFYDLSYYIIEDNSYMIPEDLVKEVDSKKV